ncbi:ralBP1-associated Eps domain-containing protein 2 isoform X2 [Pogoniulus pusillus]|uniref:ralBP1-associated Eps domain-containing protein 2 isoform X2 n=1 Tax=Pogoniulus pusillus TaxID=488313 RepID=UPI0030B98F32
MEQGPAGGSAASAAGGVLLPLSESEQQRYSELFSRCCPPPEAAAGGSSVGELFRASQLPPDTLHQITEVCGAKRVGYFGPAQFYLALKLIAAAQAGFPVRLESVKNELPLPRFPALQADADARYGPPAELHPVKFQVPHAALEKNCYKRAEEGDKQEAMSPPMSPICSPPASPSAYQRIPFTYGYGKARSGLEQQHGAPYEVRHSAHQQDGPAAGGYGAKPALACSALNRSLSVEREQQDSSSHYSDDPWRITEEQRDYYINQFRSLQPDLSSFVSGSVAKNFFTKSKLPIPELSHIWELSDVDCDGALTLPEFCAAFHLVVARKNGYQLPEALPDTLLPGYLQAASLKPIHDCTLFDSYPEALPGSQQSRECSRTEASAEEAPDKPALTQDGKKDDKQALKASAALRTIPKEFQHFTMKTAAQEPNPNVLRARPRSRSYSSTSIEDAMKKGEEPPTPPPRPQKSHSRASSLDLNKVFQQSSPAVRSAWLPPPPALPPRPSVAQEVVLAQPPSKPARRKLRTEAQGLETPEMSPTISVTSALPAAKTHLSVPRQPSRQKRAIQTAIRKNKEANAVLARLNSELQQQLKEVHKERIALETQLEQLRPVTVL